MASRGGNVSFGGGSVSGAQTDFFRDENTNVSVDYGWITAGFISAFGYFDPYSHPNFAATDFSIFSVQTKAFGIGVAFDVSWNTELAATEVTISPSAIIGLDINFTMPGINPSSWELVGMDIQP